MSRNNITKILFGIAAIFAAVVFAGSAFSWWSLEVFKEWWAVLIIIPAVGSMIAGGVNAWNSILLAAGIFAIIGEQLRALTWQQRSSIVVAICLLIFGIYLIFGNLRRKKKSPNDDFFNNNSGTYQQPDNFNNANPGGAQYTAQQPYEVPNNSSKNKADRAQNDSESNPRYLSIFSTSGHRNNSNNLQGGTATAFFGGLDVDLSNAIINRNIEFTVNSVLGRVDVFVPRNVRTEVNGIAILGGCDNLVPPTNNLNCPTLTIKYNAILGGVDVKLR